MSKTDSTNRKGTKAFPNQKSKKTGSGSKQRTWRTSKQPTPKTSSIDTEVQDAAPVRDAVNIESTAASHLRFVPGHKATVQNTGTRIYGLAQENGILELNRLDMTANTLWSVVDASSISRRTPVACTLWMTHLFGTTSYGSGAWSNPIYLSAQNILSFIKRSTNATLDVMPADLVPYFMEISQIIALAGEIQRDIRLLVTRIGSAPSLTPNFYAQALKILNPDGGTDVETYYSEKSRCNLIDRFNNAVSAFNHLPIPANLPLFGYNSDLFECIYADSPDLPTAQQFLFASRGTWVYVDDGNAENLNFPGSYVKFQPWDEISSFDNPGYKTLEDMITRLEESVSNVSLGQTNSGTFLQLLRNAYRSEQTLKLALLPRDLPDVQVSYNEDMLTSIHNASLVGNSTKFSPFVARSDINSLSGFPYIETTNAAPLLGGAVNIPLQFHKPAEQVDQGDIGNALRFHPTFKTVQNIDVYSAEHAFPEGVQTNVVHAASYYGFAMVHTLTVTHYNNFWQPAIYDVITKQMTDSTTPTLLSDFNYAPILVDYTYNAQTHKLVIIAYTAGRDVEVYTDNIDTYQWWMGLTEIAWGSHAELNVADRATL